MKQLVRDALRKQQEAEQKRKKQLEERGVFCGSAEEGMAHFGLAKGV